MYLLKKTHERKIDLIYIDPPYNTGNKSKDGGFKYNDAFIDKENEYRHSTWLSFIKKRLLLSKDLLNEKGIIFISIDDNELFNLKILCDSIFGEKNFLGNIVQNKGNAQNDAKNLQKNHDYILVYCKNREFKLNSNGELKESSLISLPAVDEKEVFVDDDGRYYYEGSGLLTGSSPTLKERPNLGYTIYFNPTSKHIIGVHDYDENKIFESDEENEIYQDRNDLLANGYVKIRPPKKGKLLGRWTWSLEKFNLESDKILITKNFSVKTKIFIEEKNVIKKGKKMYYEKRYRTNNLKSIYNFSTSKGTEALQKILPGCDFNNPKNVDMLKMIVESINKKDALILDFFAGSASTGQAVMELNEEDGGNRHFILCTNNENEICEKIAYERLKTIITGFRKDGTKYSDGIKSNLKYYRCSYIPRINTDIQNLHENLLINIKNLIQLENGIEIDNKKIRIYFNEDELDGFSYNENDLKICEKIYISSDILLTSEQEKIFEKNDIEIFIIPEYYFEDEIKEVMY